MDPAPKNASPGPRCLGDPASPHRITVAPGKKHPKPGIWMAGGGEAPTHLWGLEQDKSPFERRAEAPTGMGGLWGCGARIFGSQIGVGGVWGWRFPSQLGGEGVFWGWKLRFLCFPSKFNLILCSFSIGSQSHHFPSTRRMATLVSPAPPGATPLLPEQLCPKLLLPPEGEGGARNPLRPPSCALLPRLQTRRQRDIFGYKQLPREQ